MVQMSKSKTVIKLAKSNIALMVLKLFETDVNCDTMNAVFSLLFFVELRTSENSLFWKYKEKEREREKKERCRALSYANIL